MTELVAKYNWISVGVFLGAIVVAHFFISSPYSWRENTISELAAQHYDYRWIMKAGFMLFGLVLAIGIVSKFTQGQGNIWLEVPILIYGLAILVSGVYSTKPIVEGMPYSELASQIHSYAAQIAGFSFSIALLLHGVIEEDRSMKVIHFLTFAFVIGCSALFGLMDSGVGIIQRMMYLGSFVWLTLFYNQ